MPFTDNHLKGTAKVYYELTEETTAAKELYRHIVSLLQGYDTPDRRLNLSRARKASKKAPQGLAKNNQGELIDRR